MQIGFILRDAKILILRAVLTDIHSDMIRAGRVFKYQKRHLNLSCLSHEMAGVGYFVQRSRLYAT